MIAALRRRAVAKEAMLPTASVSSGCSLQRKMQTLYLHISLAQLVEMLELGEGIMLVSLRSVRR